MNRLHAPLFEALVRHYETGPVSFHVPGHRFGQIDEEGQSIEKNWLSTIMKLDVTELSSTDDLHHPETFIAEAQKLAARCFGAEETYFLVGGSTSGNLALILGVCEPGDLIIVQRNVHKSVINGLRLAGARAVFLMPRIDDETGLATQPSLEDIEQALELYPEAKAVMLTNPNYYGMTTNLTSCAELVHRFNKLLLVDEAHGAHYGLHPSFPQSAIQAGADAAVQSTHKTLSALTMGAMLHVQGERIPRDSIREVLAAIQSSSPSFPIMASLDIARVMVDRYKSDWFQPGVATAQAFREWIEDADGALKVLRAGHKTEAYDKLDPLRIVLWDRTGTITGFELQKKLEGYGCWAEMADTRHVVLVWGSRTTDDDRFKLQDACAHIEQWIMSQPAKSGATKVSDGFYPGNGTPSQLKPVEFSRKKKEHHRIPLTDAEGCESAEMVIPYPPGIPVIYPGETLTNEMIGCISTLAATGAKFQGAVDNTMRTIAVYSR
ncbi:aminotransferase class I/II-fold pyridoxal phosphate-dependent enzyme [Paenibacillus glycanilyticus]|uniref:aminotransferase class I/II-fold pyridoxal phosphate-dependent enzyme n=1 Tax=Paenibacillus glycanilyticus TaxID=126569 RepID=UPI002041092B|nr:aminotransferase class I/II-fold pyridoxal phosphate-dependent enzyme [Paenibacillus glycanilyticus]MCM3631289.1 aminotransferase class I/II-fold pyridoxal phosphate-dependent enzyme [Paenibacillus glycanilyticus]